MLYGTRRGHRPHGHPRRQRGVAPVGSRRHHEPRAVGTHPLRHQGPFSRPRAPDRLARDPAYNELRASLSLRQVKPSRIKTMIDRGEPPLFRPVATRPISSFACAPAGTTPKYAPTKTKHAPTSTNTRTFRESGETSARV